MRRQGVAAVLIAGIAAVAALTTIGAVRANPVTGQLQTGNLYRTVTDDKGTALPGVTVTLTGEGAPQVQVTNAQGQLRFLGLAPGAYELRAELEGFTSAEAHA